MPNQVRAANVKYKPLILPANAEDILRKTRRKLNREISRNALCYLASVESEADGLAAPKISSAVFKQAQKLQHLRTLELQFEEVFGKLQKTE